MPRIVSLAAVIVLLSFALVHAQGFGAQVYSGQRGFDPNAPTHDISGSVINAVTGEPIARALVQMYGPYQHSDLTDAQGNFHFEGVPEGQAMLMARKPGYFNSDELARGGGRPRTPVKISADMGSIVLKLTPEGIVVGTITGDDGEPLEGVQVRLKWQIVNSGRKQWQERSRGSTNEDGEFRIANLVPGKYYLLADAPRVPMPRTAGESGIGYAAAYFPGAPDLASAAPIEVRGGQTAQVDFRLRMQPVFQIGGIVSGIPPEQGASVQITNRSGDPLGVVVRFKPEDGSFSAKVPAGTYTVRASTFEQSRRSLTASATIAVAGNISNLRLALQPGASIPVVVKTEFTKQQSSPAYTRGGITFASGSDSVTTYASVQLAAIDAATPSASSDFNPKDSNAPFVVSNVEPGRYAVQIMPHGPWYVQSATYGQTDLLRDDMVVAPGGDARAIEIVLRDDGGSITGAVMSDNLAVPAMVLAVPERRAMTAQPQYAAEKGFVINRLAPSDYLLFAFDSVDGLEYSNRDALEPYLSRATRVSVANNGSANVTLTLIKRGEP